MTTLTQVTEPATRTNSRQRHVGVDWGGLWGKRPYIWVPGVRPPEDIRRRSCQTQNRSASLRRCSRNSPRDSVLEPQIWSLLGARTSDLVTSRCSACESIAAPACRHVEADAGHRRKAPSFLFSPCGHGRVGVAAVGLGYRW
eukprot:7950684-Pyramimonas_sp.AAC.1